MPGDGELTLTELCAGHDADVTGSHPALLCGGHIPAESTCSRSKALFVVEYPDLT